MHARRLVPLIVLMLTTGCARQPGVALVSAPPGAVPQRIVSLAPSVTEVLYALGAGRQMVGCTALCNYPSEARRLEHVGDMHPDLERLVALGPDLVVAESLTPDDVLRRLRALEVPVMRVDSSTLEGYQATLRTLGEATGHSAQARQLGLSLETRLQAMRETTGRIPLSARKRVFIEIWSRPLQTAGGGTFIDEMVSLAGGLNVFHDLGQYPQINPEALVARDPQVVLLTTSQPEAFVAVDAFQSLDAVRSGRVHFIDPDTLVRPGPRLLQALDALTRDLAP